MPQYLDMISIDFETFSRCDITKAGASRYAEDPSTEVLCVAWAVEEQEPEIWIAGNPAPHALFDAIEAQGMSAWNALFEMQVWDNVCTRRMGWPVVPVDKWYDTQADVLALGFPASLGDFPPYGGINEVKDAGGNRLIKKLCCPVRPTKNHPTDRWIKSEAHDDYLALYRYCMQDVRTERAIRKALPYRATERGIEREIWLSTIASNRRGIPVDVLALTAINAHIQLKMDNLNHRVQTITQGLVQTAKQRAAIQEYISGHTGVAIPNMQGATLAGLDLTKFPQDMRELLACYVQSNYASIAKFKKMEMQLCKDNTIKDNHRYHGAATGRDAGMGVQVQNLPRASVPYADWAIETLKHEDLGTVEMLFGNVLELASALCRPVLCAPDGMIFFNADLGQIEARMTAWVALEDDILQAYRDGLDAYKVAAAKMFKIQYAEVTKAQRQVGKVFVLLAGFQGGAKAVITGAVNYNLVLDEAEAQEGIVAFRESRPRLVATWRSFGEAAARAIQNPGSLIAVSTNNKFHFLFVGGHLFLSMPNGRKICFPFAQWEPAMMPWGKTCMAITHMWCNSEHGNRWERRTISGASLMQSAVQGLSRDVLMEAALRADANGFPVAFRVHDEFTSCVPDNPMYSLAEFERLFIMVPKWCPDLPIICDAWADKRYHK